MRTATVLLFALSVCRADTILLNSGISPGGYNNKTQANVLITPHPWWASASGQWISYDQTGYNGIIIPTSLETPGASFYQDFYMTEDTNRAVGNLMVWADDSATVFLDGVPLIFHSLNIGVGCTSDGIGCLPGHGVEVTFDILGDFGSKHTLQFDVFQQAGGPFGLMYSGSVILSDPPLTPNPEPGSLALLAGGLIGGAVIVRKRNASKAQQQL